MVSSETNRQTLAPFVFFPAAFLIVVAVCLAILFRDSAGKEMAAAQTLISHDFGWFYIAVMNGFLGVCAFLAFSRYGNVRLGPHDSRPDFSRWQWFAMLFSAGLGIGLFFYGVAEPVIHFTKPPRGEPGSIKAARDAMSFTMLHWGLHGWSLYGVVALAIAVPAFRRGLPGTVRSAFRPFLEERIDGRIGNAIDVLAIVATLTGVATSLGMGAQQIEAGLRFVGVIPHSGSASTQIQILIIAVVTLLATTSVVLGLDRGICRFSELNIVLAFSIWLCVLALGPTSFLLEAIVQNTGDYFSRLIELGFWAEAYTDTVSERNWQSGWTVFYWSWWISWAPFVGMFIARISRGRTVREFVVGVLLVPTLLSICWFTVFGGAALHQSLEGNTIVAEAVNKDVTTALFVFLGELRFGHFLSIAAIVSVTIFFVTSSDSGSMVIDIIASGGCSEPPVWQRIFWSVTEGIVAITLLLAGGLGVMQSANMIVALPSAL